MFKNFMIFVSGAAIGSLVTWQIVKRKYDAIIQEEIDSVKEVYSKKYAEVPAEVEEEKDDDTNDAARAKAEEAKDKASVFEYAAKLQEHGYVNYSNPASVQEEAEEEEEEDVIMDRPYVISPDDFATVDYDVVSLTYYRDKIVADIDDEIVEDLEETIGIESLNHFGEFEDDSVFVRNDRLKIDYEILLDQRTYAEARKGRP